MTPLIKPSTSTSTSSTSTATASPTSTGSADLATSTEVLAVGSKGPGVQAAQTRLKELGYWIPTPDGEFGGSTKQAVWALQKAAGISRTGKIDATTRTALVRGAVPHPRTSSGRVIEIDIARQLLLAVDGGHLTAIINASSGNGETFTVKDKKTGKETKYVARTDRGNFSVYKEENGMHESTLELGSMWRPKYFNGGIAVHGSGSVPPHPASHGCVRVTNATMNWIWDSWGASVGTPVLVY
ncbi:hypothetical protein VV02_16140 [Luteipulveratus mongoliensis]|uniref:L,D-TPase catalytic domain-containing protein n=2 Tax=Luteipulveratus mongoliensis TaxID=571913 RepID=A0A0K1JJX9_9MICO|nr:hypothetical protein VV02_16140 [Luteipulveratus mongoliensis]